MDMNAKPSYPERYKSWMKKFFWEGQLKSNEGILENCGKSPVRIRKDELIKKYRRLVAIAIPFFIVELLWFAYAIKNNIWHEFKTRYPLSITMIFGSFIAGMTTEGGGAIAFPVMTLVLKISPEIARDFSLIIQSVGMTAASFTIIFMKIQIEYDALFFCSIGAIFGSIIGYELIDPNLKAQTKKLLFVSIWFSFAFSLFLLNRRKNRKTYNEVYNLKYSTFIILLINGVFGGILTAFSGSGTDICSFCVLTLIYRVSEKVATPTSVVIMAINTTIGMFWRTMIKNEVDIEVWKYFIVCAPIVVIGAPVGSLIGTHFHRLVLASLIYVIDTVALIVALVIIKPTGDMLGMTIGIIIGGFIFFIILTKIGDRDENIVFNVINVDQCESKKDDENLELNNNISTINYDNTNSKTMKINTVFDNNSLNI